MTGILSTITFILSLLIYRNYRNDNDGEGRVHSVKVSNNYFLTITALFEIIEVGLASIKIGIF